MQSRRTTGIRLVEAGSRLLSPDLLRQKTRGLCNGQTQALWDIYLQNRERVTSREAAALRQVLALFRAAASTLAGEIARAFFGLKGKNWTLAQMRRTGRDQIVKANVKTHIRNLHHKLVYQFRDILIQEFRASFADSAYLLDQVTPFHLVRRFKEADGDGSDPVIGLDFGMPNEDAILALVNQVFLGGYFSDSLGLITDEMAQKIQSELTRSMMEGETWEEASSRIMDYMGTDGVGAVYRANMIARTELIRAEELANQTLYDQNADVIQDSIWVAHLGACDECFDNNGESVDDVGYPPAHPYCKCGTMPVPKPWDELLAGMKGSLTPYDIAAGQDALVKIQSRTQWMQDNGLGGSA